MAKAFAGNTARLAISGDNPMMLAAQDPAKVARANKAMSMAYKPALEKISQLRHQLEHHLLSEPRLGAADVSGDAEWSPILPCLPACRIADQVAVEKLANAIFAASRVDVADPIAAWAEHNANLAKRSAWLNGERFSALHFTGPGTDLTVGLADGHEWHGGASTAKNGITCNPNIPTEEVFTTPHALRVEGHVSSTKPLSHQGTLIDNIQVRFEAGRIVEAKASKGEEVLNKVLDTDEGARRLGEVALVPAFLADLGQRRPVLQHAV